MARAARAILMLLLVSSFGLVATATVVIAQALGIWIALAFVLGVPVVVTGLLLLITIAFPEEREDKR